MAAITFLLTEPPRPGGCFVEVETDDGRSVRVGEWRRREDGLWALRVTAADIEAAVAGAGEAHAEQARQLAPLMRQLRGDEAP